MNVDVALGHPLVVLDNADEVDAFVRRPARHYAVGYGALAPKLSAVETEDVRGSG